MKPNEYPMNWWPGERRDSSFKMRFGVGNWNEK